MKIILCHSILKREVVPLLDHFSKGDIKKFSEKAIKGLGIEIQGTIPPHTKLVKVYMTGKAGAGRMVVLILMRKELCIPIIVRLKKDKVVGSNLGKENQAFQKLLEKNLDGIMMDLKEKKYEELS